jgi:hypothetical protein
VPTILLYFILFDSMESRLKAPAYLLNTPLSYLIPCLIARLIFKSLGIRCVPFLDQIVPYLLQVARKCGPGLRESILQQLSLLTSIVHHNIAPFLPTLFDIIRDYWTEHQEHILTLGETDSELL